MKKNFLILCLIAFLITRLFSQTTALEKRLSDYMKTGDRKELELLIEDWEKTDPKNIELKIAYFNYYLYLDSTTGTHLGPMDNGEYGLYSKTEYVTENVHKGISYLDKALVQNNNRLDIHFGKSQALLRIQDYENLSNTILSFLDQSKKNKNQWLWAFNKSFVEENWNGEGILFEGLADYVGSMLQNFSQTEKHLKKIIDKMLKIYPNNVWGLNLAANYYINKDDLKKAESLFLKAKSIDPNDHIILFNLAYLYKSNKDYASAIQIYEQVLIQFKDHPELVEYAQSEIQRLKDLL